MTMQFFPTSYEASSTSALNGVSVQAANAVNTVAGSANEFLAELNGQLASYGITPVESGSGAPKGFRSITANQESLQSEDLQALRNSLKKRGITDDQLSSLEAMINSGQPMTMGTLVNAISGKSRSSAALTDEERLQLGSALRKMGFSQDETQSLESMMDQGQNTQAMQLINRRLRTMEAGTRVSLDKAETKSLARGLDLSDKATKSMMALFGKGDELNANKDGLTALLAHAGKEVAAKSEGAKRMAKELQGAIDDTLKEAKFRKATALDSDARASRKSERAETRMRDSLTAKSNNLGPEALAERARFLARDAGLESDHNEMDAQDKQQHLQEAGKKTLPSRKGGAESADAPPKEGTRTERSGKESFAARVTAEGVFSPANSPLSGAANQPAGAARITQQELFSQVEKSMLRELSDGSRQITLRLDPVEMGQLSVQLTVRQGEVRAVIRTDNEETTAALSQQMDQLKSSLEEQGLKVTQLEVETRLADNSANPQWDSASQYNQEQESREQARFLQLAKMRQEAGNDLARNMQNTSANSARQEEISGLHIIA